MPTDVSDEYGDPVRSGLYGVVEVSAEHAELTSGPIEAPQLDGDLVDQRMGQQTALETGRLGLAQLRLPQAQRCVFGSPPFHGISDRALQQDSVNPALDQVVLGSVGESLLAEALLREPGEDADRDLRAGDQQQLQRAQPGCVRQVEVEQDAVDRVDDGRGLGDGGDNGQVDGRLHLGQQLAHQKRISGVVLDEENADAPPLHNVHA